MYTGLDLFTFSTNMHYFCDFDRRNPKRENCCPDHGVLVVYPLVHTLSCLRWDFHLLLLPLLSIMNLNPILNWNIVNYKSWKITEGKLWILEERKLGDESLVYETFSHSFSKHSLSIYLFSQKLKVCWSYNH